MVNNAEPSIFDFLFKREGRKFSVCPT